MALIEAPEAHYHPRTYPEQPALDVLPAVPVYDTVVDTDYRLFRGERTFENIGRTVVEEWRMSDGIHYDILLGYPERQQTDVPVVKDTAWGTQVLGFNLDVAKELMRLGYPVVIKGPEKGGTIPLSQSAHNTHEILDVTGRLGLHDARVAAVEGYSRGAMIGFGTVAYGPRYRREIAFANLTDPCVFKPVEFSAEELLQRAINMRKVPFELGSAGFEIGRLLMQPNKISQYRRSVDLSLNGLRQLIRTGKALAQGETGRLASLMPSDTTGTVAFFNSSLGNDEKQFTEVLRQYEYIDIKHARGGHFTGIDTRILRHIRDSFDPVME